MANGRISAMEALEAAERGGDVRVPESAQADMGGREEGRIVLLPGARILPHPDNPRRDLGDLTELSDSIKANGILQNLTVVPHGDRYRLVIGHRRYAAGMLAGVELFPCVVSDMDYKQQLSTMLSENMQRADLTVIEQAEAFQMMMDLGASVEAIADMSGFSRTTVKRRVELMKLDRQQLAKKVEQGATLMDLARLEELEDADERNRMLAYLGSHNFDYYMQDAVRRQEAEKNRAAWIELLNSFAREISAEDTSSGEWRWAPNWPRLFNDPDDYLIPEDCRTREYGYRIVHTSAELYRKVEMTVDNEEKTDPEEEARERAWADLRKANEEAEALRNAFFKEHRVRKQDVPALLRYISFCYMESVDLCITSHTDKLLEIKEENRNERLNERKQVLSRVYEENPDQVLLYIAHSASKSYGWYQGWEGYDFPAWDEDTNLDALYELLEAMGYQRSDMELALRDPENPLYHAGDEWEEEEA